MFPFRYVIIGLSTTVITLVYAMRLAFHSTIICQYDRNDTGSDHYLADPALRGWQFSSVSIGLLIGLLPLPSLHFLGTKNVVTLYGVIGIFSCLLYPWSDSVGFLPAFVVRTIQGVPGAVFLWCINSVSQDWAPKSELGLAIAILSSMYQTAPVVAMIISGEMCSSSLGWQSTYYILAVLTAIVLAIFYFVYSDNVMDSRFASEEEKKLILEGKSGTTNASNQKVPYLQALADPQVWIAWFLYLSFFFSTYIFLQYGPTYINQVLNFDVRKTGYTGALPYIILFLLKFVYGRMLDTLCGLPLRTRMVLSFVWVEIISAGCLLLLILTTTPTVGLVVYILFNSLHGLVLVVVMKNIQLIARQHAHFLANGNTFIVAVCIFVSPIVVNWMVPDNTAQQWSMLFASLSGLIFIGAGLFAFFGKCTASKWTELQEIPLSLIENPEKTKVEACDTNNL